MKIVEGNGNEDSKRSNGSNGHGNIQLNSEVAAMHDRVTVSALSSILAIPQQSYEEFINSFMHLTPSDIENHDQQNQRILSQTDEESTVTVRAAFTQNLLSTNLCSSTKDGTLSAEMQNTNSDSDIDEEIIGEGEVIPSRFLRSESPAKLQVGNFVEDSEDDKSESDDESGYVASFMPSSNKESHDSEKIQEDNISAIEVSDDLKNMIMDSTGKYSKTTTTNEMGHNENETDELVYDPSQDLPNPGECCDSLSDIAVIHNERILDFTVLKGQPTSISENRASDLPQAECVSSSSTDDIQPFSLDENFDYDNVQLTAKFSPEEVRIIQSCKDNSK